MREYAQCLTTQELATTIRDCSIAYFDLSVSDSAAYKLANAMDILFEEYLTRNDYNEEYIDIIVSGGYFLISD